MLVKAVKKEFKSMVIDKLQKLIYDVNLEAGKSPVIVVFVT